MPVFGAIRLLVAILLAAVSPCEAQGAFSVADDIGFGGFGHAWTDPVDAITPSPDGRIIVVYLERGRLSLNKSESVLQVFRMREIRAFLENPQRPKLTPVWTISKATYKNGPIISSIRWLADSSGFAFLAKTTAGKKQLILANLQTKTLKPLTMQSEGVRAFDICDRTHYVYVVGSKERGQQSSEKTPAELVGTGSSLYTLLFPVEDHPSMTAWFDRGELWAVVAGKRFLVQDPENGGPLALYSAGQRNLALSPDCRRLVTALPLSEVPSAWAARYPPPFESYPHRIEPGIQDLTAPAGHTLVSQYAVIDLKTDVLDWRMNAPISDAAGWPSNGKAVWSTDGRAILLPATFAASASNRPSKPCVYAVDFPNGAASCVEQLKTLSASGYEEGSHYIKDAQFKDGDKRRVIVEFYNFDNSRGSTEYRQTNDGDWETAKELMAAREAVSDGILVAVKETLNDPPVLMATDLQSGISRVILDPNPQLRGVDLGEATVIRWKDARFGQHGGALYKPPNYSAARRYPLVIQSHGFVEKEFRPYGMYPTASAARELAAVGMLVLQVQDCPYNSSPEEGSCNVASYEAAVDQLAADRLITPDRIGIVGFSRTCYFVLKALTESTIHIAAASITDGVMEDYLQYMTSVDAFGNGTAAEANTLIGARPFSEGLKLWLSRSPGFQLDKVTTPLQVVALGRSHLIEMWLPYAGLRYLNRPVDLKIIDSGEHVLTNPAARLASQGGTVDWMRFWLQGYEDPDPAKVEQYRRWEKLCDMQKTANPNQPAFCVPTRH